MCPRPIVWLLLCLGCALFATAHADSPLPLAHPDLDFMVHGRIDQVVRQPDNTTIIAGSYATINGVARRALYRGHRPTCSKATIRHTREPHAKLFCGLNHTRVRRRRRATAPFSRPTARRS